MCKTKKQSVLAHLAILSVLLVVGCQKSAIAERKRAHAAEYAALSGEEKALVNRGTLREGMTTNAVLIAWGQPSVISSISTPNGPFVFWEYYRKKIVTEDPQVMVPRSPTPVPQSHVLQGRVHLQPACLSPSTAQPYSTTNDWLIGNPNNSK